MALFQLIANSENYKNLVILSMSKFLHSFLEERLSFAYNSYGHICRGIEFKVVSNFLYLIW